MADLAEHEARAIREYVNSQSPADDQAGLVQRVHSKRILGRTHDVFDVHCDKTRWWVSGWRSEREFTSWTEHFEGTRLAGYLAEPGTGISDRLHRGDIQDASGN